jgi:hypothetical protein
MNRWNDRCFCSKAGDGGHPAVAFPYNERPGANSMPASLRHGVGRMGPAPMLTKLNEPNVHLMQLGELNAPKAHLM